MNVYNIHSVDNHRVLFSPTAVSHVANSIPARLAHKHTLVAHLDWGNPILIAKVLAYSGTTDRLGWLTGGGGMMD